MSSYPTGLQSLLNGEEAASSSFNLEAMTRACGQDGEYNKWMMEELNKGNPDSLRVWQMVIRLLDKMVRQSSGTPTLNALLAVAEKGFKSEEMDIRMETFKAWEALIDNFSKSEAILNNPKRIKLITRPLVVTLKLFKNLKSSKVLLSYYFYF